MWERVNLLFSFNLGFNFSPLWSTLFSQPVYDPLCLPKMVKSTIGQRYLEPFPLSLHSFGEDDNVAYSSRHDDHPDLGPEYSDGFPWLKNFNVGKPSMLNFSATCIQNSVTRKIGND